MEIEFLCNTPTTRKMVRVLCFLFGDDKGSGKGCQANSGAEAFRGPWSHAHHCCSLVFSSEGLVPVSKSM
uniref:Uncharacterized protein n=1 Tax=Hordeum vulgare subsp. vulgare TaxID=112509 RepID=A0A8I6WYG0_HORVV